MKAYANVTSDDGENDYGSLEIPPELLRKALKAGLVSITFGSDSITFELNGGLQVYIHLGDDNPMGIEAIECHANSTLTPTATKRTLSAENKTSA